MDALDCLRTLRAVRRYRDEPVPEAVLRDILEAARWTGSGKNTQRWHFVVVRDRGALTRLSGMGMYAGHLAGAPLGIALLMEGDEGFAAFDLGRAAHSMMLVAHERGVGACIAAIYAEHEAGARELLGVPDRYLIRLVIAFGYPVPREEDRTIAGQPREQVLAMVGRKPLEEIVSYERFGQREL